MTDLKNLGPLQVTEGMWARRIRLHQAWFRYAVLAIDTFGILPPPSGAPCGSSLPQSHAQRGANFIDAQSFADFIKRRREGWGVEPLRCMTVMTSSQTLTFNIFSGLLRQPEWFCRTLRYLGLAASKLLSGSFEPGPLQLGVNLGHRTHIDFLIEVELDDGSRRVVAWEVKLTDRFVSRRSNTLGPKYAALDERLGILKGGALSATPESLQLLRIYLLAAGVSQSKGYSQPPLLYVLHHELDTKTGRLTMDCVRHFRSPKAVRTLALNQFLKAMRDTACSDDEAMLAGTLERRYTNLDESAHLWHELEDARRR